MNALDIAIEAGQKDVAMVIVNSKQWQAALRNVTETSTGFTTPMRRLIQRMPDVAETVFNRCMTTNEDEVTEDDPEFRVTFNYEFLEDFRVHKDYFRRRATWRQPPVPARQGSSTSLLDDQNIDNDDSNVGYQTTWGPEKYSRKDHCLHIMTHSKNQDLLKHPLPASLLNYKWVKYGQLAYMANVGIQFVFVLLLTTFAFLLQSPITSLCARVNSGNFSGNIDECAAEGTEDVTNGRLIITPVVGVLVIIIAIIKLNFEAAQMLKDFLNYFKDWINYLELILFCFTIIFAFIFFNPCFCPTSWQWQFGAVAMFLGWIDLIIIIRKFPVTGIYVVMFMNIFYIFLKLVFLAILLILAFGISFYMVFHIPLNIENRIRTPFQDLGRSLMKTMTMTTGEFEYDSIFRQEGDMPDVPDLEFPAVSYILWILFIILMPILLTNLLVGLAVDDIKGMQQSAAISRLALRVELTLTLEEYIPLPLRKKMIIGHMTIKPNRKLKFFDFIRYRILGVFRFDSDQNINQYIHPIPTPLEQMKKQNEFLSDKVENLKKTMNTLIDQNEKMMATITMIAEGQGMIVESTDKPTLI
jgi:transient receptor potential cation channel subfamily A protein 1